MISSLALNQHLAQPKTSWQLCILAALGGCASAALVILFTFTINGLSEFYQTQVANYISLENVSRLIIPIIGAFVILIFAKLTGYQYVRTGIPFVLHRLKVAYGVMPFRNTLHQFFGGATAIATGFSVGREGPAVHLGAACSSYIGSRLKLPFNAIRTLCACGIAAGISASFNTPIAAVLFVMEVILREYKIHIFIPIMIAAIVGSMITQQVYGPAHQYEFFAPIALTSIHFPYLILFGVVLGVLASIFNKQMTLLIKFSSPYSLKYRLLCAAIITGLLGYLVPLASSNELLLSDVSPQVMQSAYLLLALLAAKMLMTIVAIGLGIPGGIVGPILSIGAIAGLAASGLAGQLLPGEHLDTDYALMGMAGFMAATLNAPLAALLAVMELSNQIDVIIPVMIVISVACVSSGQFFKNRSVFVMQLEIQQLIYRQPPIEKSLQRVGVLSILQSNIDIINDDNELTLIKAYQQSQGSRLLITKHPSKRARFIWHQARVSEDNDVQSFDSHQLIPMSSRATLSEAYLKLIEQRQGGVGIYHNTPSNLIGVVSFAQIRRYLLEGTTKP